MAHRAKALYTALLCTLRTERKISQPRDAFGVAVIKFEISSAASANLGDKRSTATFHREVTTEFPFFFLRAVRITRFPYGLTILKQVNIAYESRLFLFIRRCNCFFYLSDNVYYICSWSRNCKLFQVHAVDRIRLTG